MVGMQCMFSGIFLCKRPANGRRRYNVMSFLIGWAHTQNDPCALLYPYEASLWRLDSKHTRLKTVKQIKHATYHNIYIGINTHNCMGNKLKFTKGCLDNTFRFGDHFVYGPCQWETTLQCNVVSHWLDAHTKNIPEISFHSNAFFFYFHGTTV